MIKRFIALSSRNLAIVLALIGIGTQAQTDISENQYRDPHGELRQFDLYLTPEQEEALLEVLYEMGIEEVPDEDMQRMATPSNNLCYSGTK